MSDQANQTAKMPDDPWLIKAFTEFETMPTPSKADMDWSVTTDFKVFSEFLVNDIQDIQGRLEKADDAYLYYVCQHIFNIIDWMTLIVTDNGALTFIGAFENVFEKKFGDRHILQNLYDVCFTKWLSQKEGQQQIGQNFYNILEGKLFYRNRLLQWFAVDNATAFDLKPKNKHLADADIIARLNRDYRETWYDKMLKQWEDRQYQGRLPDDFLQFQDRETSPETYFDYTIPHIQKLLKEPVSIAELERWNHGSIEDLEDIIKISALALELVNKRRKDDCHTIYLLRDCLAFYEVNQALDIVRSENSSADQILVGRKLLSQKSKESGYYILTLTSLYEAHVHYPNNFKDFYNDYSRLLDMFASLNPGFAAIITDLADYIKKHIHTDKKKIIIFDIGFQGSIALLTKYIIDHHICPSGPNGTIETDIKIGVGAVWSKKLFGERHEDDYFPFLNRVQLLARNNDLYHYKPGSLHKGSIRVEMGDKKSQHKAAIELVILVMVTLLAQQG